MKKLLSNLWAFFREPFTEAIKEEWFKIMFLAVFFTLVFILKVMLADKEGYRSTLGAVSIVFTAGLVWMSLRHGKEPTHDTRFGLKWSAISFIVIVPVCAVLFIFSFSFPRFPPPPPTPPPSPSMTAAEKENHRVGMEIISKIAKERSQGRKGRGQPDFQGPPAIIEGPESTPDETSRP